MHQFLTFGLYLHQPLFLKIADKQRLHQHAVRVHPKVLVLVRGLQCEMVHLREPTIVTDLDRPWSQERGEAVEPLCRLDTPVEQIELVAFPVSDLCLQNGVVVCYVEVVGQVIKIIRSYSTTTADVCCEPPGPSFIETSVPTGRDNGGEIIKLFD